MKYIIIKTCADCPFMIYVEDPECGNIYLVCKYSEKHIKKIKDFEEKDAEIPSFCELKDYHNL